VPFKDFKPLGQSKPLAELPLVAKVRQDRLNDPEKWDLCAAVKWIKAVGREDGVLKNRARMGTLSRIRQPELVAELLKHFGPERLTDSDELRLPSTPLVRTWRGRIIRPDPWNGSQQPIGPEARRAATMVEVSQVKELWQLPPALESAAQRLAAQGAAAPAAGARPRHEPDVFRLEPTTRRERMSVKKLLCRIWGHDRMQTAVRQRVCRRCGQREMLRQLGNVPGWEEFTDTAR